MDLTGRCAQISPTSAIASGAAESESPGEEKFKQPFYQDSYLAFFLRHGNIRGLL